MSDVVKCAHCAAISHSEPTEDINSNCMFCFGLFTRFLSDDFVNEVVAEFSKYKKCDSVFSLSFEFPPALYLTQILLYFSANSEYKVNDDVVFNTKSAYKSLLLPKLQSQITHAYTHHGGIEIHIHLTDDLTESYLFKLNSFCCEMRPLSKRSKQDILQNNQQLLDILRVTSLSRVLEKVSPLQLPSPKGFVKIRTPSIFIGGRYCKFSRKCSQSNWVINGKQMSEFSVEDLISRPFLKLFAASEAVFRASGREDIDVLMLGNGRPFSIEFVCPMFSQFKQDDIDNVTSEVNSSTIISINSVKIINKNDLKVIKEGEELKRKHYSAVIYCQNGCPSTKQLDELVQRKELVIHQKTPIRVLHRRPLLTRERMIHSMNWKQLDEKHFMLQLITQSGTYVKEFVHGDLGRTVPNVKALLNTEADIIQLDVDHVDLDWPL